MAPCRSARSTPTSTSSRSRNECWRGGGRGEVVEETKRLRKGAEPWIFYEGPPTANGRPGLHHVWARVFKDLYPRFQTMRGHDVPRKGGWDCHGLPVEIEVEKELGLTNKHEIEAFGVAEFTERCRDSVSRYVEDWAALTERSGRLDRHQGRVLDAVQRVHRVGLVDHPPDVGQGAGLRRPPSHAVLSQVRHCPREPRSRAGLPRRRRPVGVRALPDHRRWSDRRRPPRVDDHTLDSRLERRRRHRSRSAVPTHPRCSAWARRHRGRAQRRGALRSRGRRRRRALHRRSDLVGWRYQRPFTDLPLDDSAAARRRGRLRVEHRRLWHGAHRAGVRRGRRERRPRRGSPGAQPGRRRRRVRPHGPAAHRRVREGR